MYRENKIQKKNVDKKAFKTHTHLYRYKWTKSPVKITNFLKSQTGSDVLSSKCNNIEI